MTLAQRFEEKGEKRGIEKVAIRLLKRNEKVDFVAEATGLTPEKVKSIQKQIQEN